MKNIVETLNQMLNAIDSLAIGELKIAMICTLFDHVCETEGYNKSDKIDHIAEMVKEVEAEMGEMYDETK